MFSTLYDVNHLRPAGSVPINWGGGSSFSGVSVLEVFEATFGFAPRQRNAAEPARSVHMKPATEASPDEASA